MIQLPAKRLCRKPFLVDGSLGRKQIADAVTVALGKQLPAETVHVIQLPAESLCHFCGR